MDPRNLVKLLFLLAALGGVILLATKVVGTVGSKAASALP